MTIAGETIRTSAYGTLGVTPKIEVADKTQKRNIQIKGLHASITITLKDENEKQIKREEYPANSFVLNFMRLLYSVFTASSIIAKNTEGVEVTARMTRIRRTISYTIEHRMTTYDVENAGFQAWAMKEDDSHGILVGSGSVSLTPDDYKLASQIRNGLAYGQLLYLSSEVSQTYTVGNEAHIFIKRSFINHCGVSVYVREIGVAVKQFSPEANILFIRDLITEQEVPNNYTLDVTYTIEVTV
jgi:hypothetical protein